MTKKRERVPNVLWALFKHKARPLSTTIMSIIPQNCDCHGRGKCLRCVFGNGNEAAMSYLVRPDDPLEYRRFMRSCFVVIPQNAPPFPALVTFTQFWSQFQVIERTIQECFTKESTPLNVICHGYQKFKMVSPTIKLLTQSMWNLALKRVGDSVMVYLLMHTLIFLPTKRDVHQQLTGPPVNRVFGSCSLHIPNQNLESSANAKIQTKRRRGNEEHSICEEPPTKIPVKSVKPNTRTPVGSVNENYVGTVCSISGISSQLTEVPEVFDDNESHKLSINEEKPIETLKVTPGKRVRLPSWQRRKRFKKLVPDGLVRSSYISRLDDDKHKAHRHGLVDNQCQGSVESTFNRSDTSKGVNVPLFCQCCSAFQSLPRLPVEAQINRNSMFYNSKLPSSLFLEKHILNMLKPDIAGGKALLQNILGLTSTDTSNLPALCFHKKGCCSLDSSCLYHTFVKTLRVCLYRAKKCRHAHLLKKHCSSGLHLQIPNRVADSTLQDCKRGGSDSAPIKQDTRGCRQPRKHNIIHDVMQNQFGLSQPYCLKDEVVSFVWAVCRNIIPPGLLGIASSHRILQRNISKFIKLRRFEKFSLKQCMHKLELSKFPLFSGKQSLNCCNSFASHHGTVKTAGVKQQNSKSTAGEIMKYAFLERWIFWFFACIVVPLVRTNFYVTESEHGKLNLFYYQKPVWQKLSDEVIRLLKDQSYQSLNNASVADILRKRSFGFSKVRLCPKESGARPIANLKAPSRFCIGKSHPLSRFHGKLKRKRRAKSKFNGVTYFKAVNTVLRDLHIVLKNLKIRQPERWGSTVFCYDDIYRKLCSFLRHLKDGHAVMPPVYIVVSDVQKAFDTVKQDKLLSILNEIQLADKYIAIKSSDICCWKTSVWFSEDVKLMAQGIAEVMPSVRRRCFHRVSVNQEQYKTIHREDLQLILSEHLKNNVLKLGPRFFLQYVGIPQGSVLSTLLCTLYYGHLETNVIVPYLAKCANDESDKDDSYGLSHGATPHASFSSPKSVLLRFVDDFLFISTSKKQALTFFSRLRRGFQAYNCFMNQEKFCTNFDCNSSQKPGSKRLLVGSDGVSFLQWSGLLINSSNLEVQADYSRYWNDHLSSTLTVTWQLRPGRKLKAKLRAYMRPKCHAIFFDPTINSPSTIKLNVYQAFVLCAMKFHCYIRELSTWSKPHIRSQLTGIEGSLRYMFKLMKRRMFKVNSGCQPILQVSKQEVTWLGLTAFSRVLAKKKSRHGELLQLLKAKLVPISGIGCSPELKYAVDDCHSSLLWKIKF